MDAINMSFDIWKLAINLQTCIIYKYSENWDRDVVNRYVTALKLYILEKIT